MLDAMLQAHSLLWHYLWVGPNVLLLVLALLIWRRSAGKQFPLFLAFAVVAATGQLGLYAADVIPSVSGVNFWRIDWGSLMIESLLKFVLLGEIFSRVFNPYSSISRLGKIAVSGVGVVLVFVAAVAAAYSQGDSTVRLISGVHVLEQTVFIVESGLIIFLLLFAAYFQLSWDRFSFGVLLGLGVSSFQHLATWALVANAAPSSQARNLVDFLNMATYHVSVMIWYYYLLIPQKSTASIAPADPLAEVAQRKDLELWNRELERLLQ